VKILTGKKIKNWKTRKKIKNFKKIKKLKIEKPKHATCQIGITQFCDWTPLYKIFVEVQNIERQNAQIQIVELKM
jgi:hypothetical protein